MRNCAAVADQFAQMVPYVPYNSAAQANGQFPIVGQAAATPQTGGKRKMRGGEDGEGKKQLRPKKPKDPNAPKRPASSYLLFQNDVRQELKAKNPALPNNELLGIISKMWKGMSDEDKEVCKACAILDPRTAIVFSHRRTNCVTRPPRTNGSRRRPHTKAPLTRSLPYLLSLR